MNKIKKILFNSKFYFIACFFLFFIMTKNCMVLSNNDDIIFAKQWNEMGALRWMCDFYFEWSGRVFLSAIDAILLNLPILLWKILNSLIFAQMMTNIVKITDIKWLRFALILLFFSIPQVTLTSSTLWITGSLNYLWPVSFSFVIIYICKKIFSNENISSEIFFYSLIASFFACNMEQTAAVCLVLMICSMFYKRLIYKNNDKKEFILLACIIFFTCILMFSPGNFARSASEMLQWNPSFDMLSLLDKIFYGLYALMNYLFYDLRQIWYCFAWLLFIINIFDFKRALFMLYFLSFKDEYSDFYQNYQLMQQYNPAYLNADFLWKPFFCGFGVLMLMLSSAIQSMKNERDKIWLFLIFCASICTVIIIGFSPTLTGSGERVYFYMAVLLIYVMLETVKKFKYELILTVGLCLFNFVPAYHMIQTILINSNYLWYF